jgi:hypothetical protein
MNFNYRDFFIHNDDNHIIKEELSIVDEMADVSKKDAPVPNATPDWKRKHYYAFIYDASEIYDLYKNGIKEPEKIVKLINQNRKPYLQINLDKVNLALKIVDIATKQMENTGHINAREIERQINGTITLNSIISLIKNLGIGELKHKHKFTPEQDAFILYNYLQRIDGNEITKRLNKKFRLNLFNSPLIRRLKNVILKSQSESEISEYALKLLRDYKNEYFSTVDIEDPKTKALLTHYIPPYTSQRKDPLARKQGKVDPTRKISGQTGNLEPDIHQTITTGEIPASGQLGKKSGAPINLQGTLTSL